MGGTSASFEFRSTSTFDGFASDGSCRSRCSQTGSASVLQTMRKHEKLVAKILEGRADASIRFKDLRRLLMWMGFVERVRGSHDLFRHVETGARINLQSAGGLVKPYQVRQVRVVIMELRKRKSD